LSLLLAGKHASSRQRERYFFDGKYAELFIDTLYRYREQKKYWIHCFVVMPEHFHLLITPLGITILQVAHTSRSGEKR